MTYTYDTDPTYGTTNDGEVVRINVGSDYQERYTFDQYERPISTIRTIGTQTYTTTNQYNQASQPLQNAFGTFAYDNVGRVSSITGPGNVGMSGMTYNIAGQVTAETLTSTGWYNGYLINSSTAETYGYDTNHMQLISQTAVTTNTNAGPCIPSCPPPPAGGTNLSLNYSYQATAGQMGVGTTQGNTGQLMAINNNSTIGGVAESASYSYDNYGRLATSNQTSNGLSAQRRFAYDRWGNRSGMWDATSGGTQIQSVSNQTVSFPGTGSAPTNRITSVTGGGTLNYTYDADGNLTKDGVNSYEYDSENRLIKSIGGVTASYAYDHQNRRYKKTISGSVTHYVWEGSQVVGEYNGSTGAMLAQYGYAGSRMIAKTAGGATQYFLSDRLSARLALSDVGAVAGRQATLPFGEDFAESGTQEKHHFTSYERDGESGTDYAVNRQYSQTVGKFMQVDPIDGSRTVPTTLNRYAYVQGDPINRVDPIGLFGYLCFTYLDPILREPETEKPLERFTCIIFDDDQNRKGPTKPTPEKCRQDLSDDLRKAGFANSFGTVPPTADQFNMALASTISSGVGTSLLLTTWYFENSFADPAVNHLGPKAKRYGPLQLSVLIADQYGQGTGFSLDQIVGQQDSGTFTGDISANLIVGGLFLNYLAGKANGDLALAGTAFQFPGALTRSGHLNPKERNRYNWYKKTLPIFSKFTTCMIRALRGAEQ